MTDTGLVSIIIPSRNEKYLGKTIEDLLTKAVGEIEIIAVLDGYWPEPKIPDNDRLILIHRGSPQGMRPAINAATAIARGRYLMKCDAHCLFAPGFDQALKDDY